MTTRESLIHATAKLIRQQGVNATGINEILRVVGIPKGSLYHHFPGGKDELVIAALHYAKEYLSQKFKMAMKGKASVEKGLEAVLDDYAAGLQKSNYSSGCPMATVALEVAGNNEAIRQACNEVLDYWIDSLVAYFKHKNSKAGKKEAMEFMTRLEGALLIAQIQKSDRPLKALKGQLADIIKNSTCP
jgi:TetR/AcrR family transcriptional regulator, lmrAB and yxaGH operons repressor